jgi:16S rRNA (uracil1498-N3)-methyltransferase
VITLLAETGIDGSDREEVRVDGDAYRHLFRARRVPVGAALRVVDGRGQARWGTVTDVGRAAALVTLGQPAPDNEPAFRLEVLVTTLRPERASWLVEKTTELGVSAIRFLNSARAPREFGGGTIDRMRRVAAAAVEQCHRSRIPDITGPHGWQEVGPLAEQAAGSGNRWWLDTAAGEEGWGEVTGASGALLVGPEGGWSPEERDELLAASWRPVGLGSRVLRAETAAVVGTAFLMLGGGVRR